MPLASCKSQTVKTCSAAYLWVYNVIVGQRVHLLFRHTVTEKQITPHPHHRHTVTQKQIIPHPHHSSQAHCNTKTDHSTSTSQLTVTQKQIIPHPHHSVTQKQITPHSHHRHSATKTDYSTSTSKGIRETDHSTSTSQGNRETDHSTSTSHAHTTQATEHSPTDPKQAIPLLPCDNRITEVIAMHIFKSFTEARAEKPGILPPF